ncbi:MAG: hypothetical protein GY737_18895 [Desulfobacteraceae bacterium]|nr:hypothetical protein [Desulfobacteraceae bacterium]
MIIGTLIWGAGFLTLKHLQKEVPQRTGARLYQNGTQGHKLNNHILGDKAGALQSLFALWAIHQALDAYPPMFLKSQGPNILLANQLSLLGHPISGTVQIRPHKSWVILASNYLLPSLDLQFMRRTFHHEFSSILIANTPFPHSDWKATLPAGFSFPKTDQERLEALQDYPSAAEMDVIYARGFVAGYGRSSQENDINTYAELLLDAPVELVNLASRYPAIAKKAALISGFYKSLDPSFKISNFTTLNHLPSSQGK